MKKLSKVEHYKWSDPGEHGEYQLVSVNDLFIDHEYQRDKTPDQNILATARNFNWIAFGVTVVLKREDGKMYVVDGQQRIEACKRRGDIKKVPCIVFNSFGQKEEAGAFLDLNTRRKNVPAYDKYRAAVLKEQNPEKEINDWLLKYNLKITKDAETGNSINFPTTIVQTWKQNKEAAQKALLIQKYINSNESFVAKIHKGFFWALSKGIDLDKYVNKIISSGGKFAILKSIKMIAIETGQRESGYICGLGVIKLINAGKRNKITTDGN